MTTNFAAFWSDLAYDSIKKSWVEITSYNFCMLIYHGFMGKSSLDPIYDVPSVPSTDGRTYGGVWLRDSRTRMLRMDGRKKQPFAEFTGVSSKVGKLIAQDAAPMPTLNAQHGKMANPKGHDLPNPLSSHTIPTDAPI